MTVDTTLTPATDNDTNQALHLREHPPTQLDDYSVAPVPSSAVTPKPTPSQSSTATPCTPLRVTHLPRTTAIHSLFSQPKSHQDHHETADTKPCQPVDIHLSPTAEKPTYDQLLRVVSLINSPCNLPTSEGETLQNNTLFVQYWTTQPTFSSHPSSHLVTDCEGVLI